MIEKFHPERIKHSRLAEDILSANDVLYKKITENCRLPISAVPSAMAEVVRYLNLIAYSNETLTPSKLVDDVWHEFILCTKAYYDFCDRHFERMIHHFPGGSEEKNHRQFHRTLELYRQYFGEPKPMFWGRGRQIAEEADCGACESA